MEKRKRVSWGRWVAYLLLAVIVLRAGIMYQRWTRIYTNKSIEFANNLRNGVIAVSYHQNLGINDPAALEELRALWSSSADIMSQTGWLMDQMAAGKPGALGRVGYGLLIYTSDILGAPYDETPGRFDEDLPRPTPDEALARLKQVYDIYAKHFTDRVIYSQSGWIHRRALDNVYEELAEKGLDRLLRRPLYDYLSID